MSSTTENAQLQQKKKIHFIIPHLGILYGGISGFFFSLCSVIVKHLTYVSPIQLAMFRFVGMLVPTLAASVWLRQNVFPQKHRLDIILRSVFGCSSLLLQFYAYQHMPLGDASVIIFSLPVFVPIFARIFLKEICTLLTFICIVVTICGVVLIIQPSFLFGTLAQEDDTSGSVAAVCSLILASMVYIMIRKLKALHYCIIMLDFSSFSIMFTLILTATTQSFQFPSCGWDVLLLYGIALFSYLGQICFTKALQIEEASIVAISRTMDVVFAFIWQIIWFDERPNFPKILGACLVTGCVINMAGIQKCLLNGSHGSKLKKKMQFLLKDITCVESKY